VKLLVPKRCAAAVEVLKRRIAVFAQTHSANIHRTEMPRTQNKSKLSSNSLISKYQNRNEIRDANGMTEFEFRGGIYCSDLSSQLYRLFSSTPALQQGVVVQKFNALNSFCC
jgi:hypothetical protein